MNCALIDDEPLALELLQSYVQRTPFLTLAGSYSSAVEAAEALKNAPVELVFCDIQMPGLSGLDFAKLLPEQTQLVFTTAFKQYAVEGYKVNAIDYLLKPITYDDFLAAAQKAQKNALTKSEEAAPAEAEADHIFVKSEYKIIRIETADILYVEGLKDYVKIYLESQPRPVLSLASMHNIEEGLPASRFLRVHRSFIVNMDKVRVIERGQIIFGDKRITISEAAKDRVNDYITKNLLTR